jgi:hypothetical protein
MKAVQVRNNVVALSLYHVTFAKFPIFSNAAEKGQNELGTCLVVRQAVSYYP